MEHFLLPVGDLRAAAAREAIRVEVVAKATREERKRDKDDRQDIDCEDGFYGGRKPQWHAHHKQVWDELIADGACGNVGEWSVEAAQILPAHYADNVWFQSMAVRNRDILRMIDIKSRPEDLV